MCSCLITCSGNNSIIRVLPNLLWKRQSLLVLYHGSSDGRCYRLHLHETTVQSLQQKLAKPSSQKTPCDCCYVGNHVKHLGSWYYSMSAFLHFNKLVHTKVEGFMSIQIPQSKMEGSEVISCTGSKQCPVTIR